MSGEQKHLPSLDGYRGFAMWMVVAYHMSNSPGFGWLAIQMFFVLSGFLITRMLLVEEHLPLGEALKLFYWRRALRIGPALYTYLLVLLAASFVWSDLASARPMMGWAAVYLHNLAWTQGADAGISGAGIMATQHLWSLCVEEHFYLFWPLLFLVAGTRHRMKLIFAFILLAPVIRLLIQLNWPEGPGSPRGYPMVIYVFSGSHIDAFALGALLTMILQRPSSQQPRLWVFLVLCAAVAAVGLLAGGDFHLPRTIREIRQFSFGYPLFMHESGTAVWGYTILDLLCAQALLLTVYHPVVSKFLGNRLLRWSGKISYSMYLIHQPVLYMFRESRPAIAAYLGSGPVAIGITAVAYLVTIFLVSSVSFRWFESRFIRIKPRHRTVPAGTQVRTGVSHSAVADLDRAVPAGARVERD